MVEPVIRANKNDNDWPRCAPWKPPCMPKSIFGRTCSPEGQRRKRANARVSYGTISAAKGKRKLIDRATSGANDITDITMMTLSPIRTSQRKDRFGFGKHQAKTSCLKEVSRPTSELVMGNCRWP
jgi:hypothetical protein